MVDTYEDCNIIIKKIMFNLYRVSVGGGFFLYKGVAPAVGVRGWQAGRLSVS